MELQADQSLTEEQVQQWAAHTFAAREFKEVMRRAKADVIMRWANTHSLDEREEAHRDLHALGRLEQKLQSLNEADVIRNRKIAKQEAIEARLREIEARRRPPGD